MRSSPAPGDPSSQGEVTLEIRAHLVMTHQQYSPEPSAGATQTFKTAPGPRQSPPTFVAGRSGLREAKCLQTRGTAVSGSLPWEQGWACHHLGGPGSQGWVCWLAAQGLAPVEPEKVRLLRWLHLGRQAVTSLRGACGGTRPPRWKSRQVGRQRSQGQQHSR